MLGRVSFWIPAWSNAPNPSSRSPSFRTARSRDYISAKASLCTLRTVFGKIIVRVSGEPLKITLIFLLKVVLETNTCGTPNSLFSPNLCAMRSIRASPLCRAFPGPSIVGPMIIVVPSVHVKVHSIFLILSSSALGVYVCSGSNSSVGKRS